MFTVEPPPPVMYVQEIQEPEIAFDLTKVQQVHDNYTVNYHAGLTMVMGHPFGDAAFCRHIEEEQNAIKDVFILHQAEDLLVLYDVEYQLHATLIELASQHDKSRNDQQFLEEIELQVSGKQNLMNINYSIQWIRKTPPFDIEIGPEVLSEDHREQTLRITDAGQFVIKGRAKDRKLLADMRAEFEKEAHITHKYGSGDDEFFFVIGYLKPDQRLLDRGFRDDLQKCINARRPIIQLALRIDSVKFIMYNNFSLDRNACLWESKAFKLLEEPDLPKGNLIDTVRAVIAERKLFLDRQLNQEAI